MLFSDFVRRGANQLFYVPNFGGLPLLAGCLVCVKLASDPTQCLDRVCLFLLDGSVRILVGSFL